MTCGELCHFILKRKKSSFLILLLTAKINEIKANKLLLFVCLMNVAETNLHKSTKNLSDLFGLLSLSVS